MSAETPKPQPGDMVEARIAGQWIDDERGRGVYDPVSGWRYALPKEAVVEVLERAGDPDIGIIRHTNPSRDGSTHTAIKVGTSLSAMPSERSAWVIVETGEFLAEGAIDALGEVVGAVPDSPAAKGQSPARPSVRVPNEPHGIPNEVRREIAEALRTGNKLRAVGVLVGFLGIDEVAATEYVEGMSEYQAYLAAQDRTEVDPTEAVRLRAMGFDRQPPFTLTDEHRAEIREALWERQGEFNIPDDAGVRRLAFDSLSGVVADLVFAAIRRDRERRPS